MGGGVHPEHILLNFGLTSFFYACSTYCISNSIVTCLFPFSFYLFGCTLVWMQNVFSSLNNFGPRPVTRLKVLIWCL